MPTVIGPIVLSPSAPVGSPRRYADILIPEARADVPAGGTLGSPSVDSDRDLAGATPTQALRTRITRMVVNEENAYAHLRDWGLGPKRGRLARPADLERMRLNNEAKAKTDPDVKDISIHITPAPQGARRAFLYTIEVIDRFNRKDRFLTTGEE